MFVAPSTSAPSISPRTSFSAKSSGPACGLTKFVVPHWLAASPPRMPCPLPETFVQSPGAKVWSVSTQNALTACWLGVRRGCSTRPTVTMKRSPGASTAPLGNVKVRLPGLLCVTAMPVAGMVAAFVLS